MSSSYFFLHFPYYISLVQANIQLICLNSQSSTLHAFASSTACNKVFQQQLPAVCFSWFLKSLIYLCILDLCNIFFYYCRLIRIHQYLKIRCLCIKNVSTFVFIVIASQIKCSGHSACLCSIALSVPYLIVSLAFLAKLSSQIAPLQCLTEKKYNIWVSILEATQASRFKNFRTVQPQSEKMCTYYSICFGVTHLTLFDLKSH